MSLQGPKVLSLGDKVAVPLTCWLTPRLHDLDVLTQAPDIVHDLLTLSGHRRWSVQLDMWSMDLGNRSPSRGIGQPALLTKSDTLAITFRRERSNDQTMG